MNKNKIDLTRANVYVCPVENDQRQLSCGKRFDLIQYKDIDEFMHACSGQFPGGHHCKIEYFDYENIPEVYISEDWLCPGLFPLIRHTAGMKSRDEQEAFSLWLDKQRPDLEEQKAEKLIETFRFCYEGRFQNPLQFGKFYAKEQLHITAENSPDFDFPGYTKLLFNGMFVFMDGYVFKDIKIS